MPPRLAGLDRTAASLVEEHYTEWYEYQSNVPGVEVHVDPDITWTVFPVWGFSNGGIRLRFQSATVDRRLDEILSRYRSAGVGAGFWVSPSAEPADLEKHFRERGMRCRKYFPGLYCDRLTSEESHRVPQGVKFQFVQDHAVFSEAVAHPYLGPVTTAIRRFELHRIAHLVRQRPQRVWDFMAVLEDKPVGVCSLFLGSRMAGFHNVGVIPSARGRGIGSALMAHACRFAWERNYREAVLISTGSGYRMYARVGFREVCKLGYWYYGKRNAADDAKDHDGDSKRTWEQSSASAGRRRADARR